MGDSSYEHIAGVSRRAVVSLLLTFFLLSCTRMGYEPGVVRGEFEFDGAGGAFAGESGIVVLWNEARNASGKELYRVYRSTSPGGQDLTAPPLAILPYGTPLYMDPEPAGAAGVPYYYCVTAVFDGVEHGADVEVTATVGGAVEIAVLSFAGVGGAFYLNGKANILWSEASGVDRTQVTYDVFRATTAGAFDFATPLVSLPPGSILHVDETLPDLTEGSEYFYAVRAVYQGADDGNTREVAVTVVDESQTVDSCPADMANVEQRFCIDIDDHDGLPLWQDALATCQSEGKELCSLQQWYNACAIEQATGTLGLNLLFDGYEWVNQLASSSSAHKVGFSAGNCSAVSSHAFDGGYDFRCCR